MSVNSDIVARLDVVAEYRSWGVRFAGDVPNSRGWVPCYAFGREDSKPSAAVNTTTGGYKDSSGDGESLTIFEFAAVKAGKYADWKEARKAYAEKTGVPLGNGKVLAKPIELIDHPRALDYGIWSWCSHRPGITEDAVRAAGARLARHDLKIGRFVCLALPIFGAVLTHPCGHVLWNTAGDGDSLAPLPVWNRERGCYSWVKMKTAPGSDSGIMGEVDRLASAEIVWKVEGPSDGLALMSAIPPEARPGVVVIWNAGGSLEHPLEWFVRLFAGKVVYVCHDADEPGEKGRIKWAGAIARHAADVREVVLPYPVRPSHGRDLRDWFVEGHSYEELLGLLPGAKSEPLELLPIEVDADPHRLARIYLDRWATMPPYGVRLRFWRGQWWCYDGIAHLHRSDGDMRADINRACKAEFDRLNLHQQREMTKSADPPAALCVTKTLVGNVLAALESMCALSSRDEQPFWIAPGPSEWPATEMLAMKDALVHLPSLVDSCESFHVDPTDNFFSLAGLPFTLDRDPPVPERWLRFLRDQWPHDEGAIGLLQEWFGYCLLPDTSQQRMLLLLGPKRSGKGTISRVLQSLIGEANCTTPKLAQFGTEFGQQGLIGKTLAIVTDARLSGRPDLAVIVESLLSISGEDLQTISIKYKDPVVTLLRTRFMIVSNEMPRLPDDSGALASRFMILNTSRPFSHSEQDKTLAAKFQAELPGILMWAIEGWQRLRNRGWFAEPDSALDQTRELYRLTSDIHSWVGDNCVLDVESSTSTKRLYDDYCQWSQENGSHPRDSRVFGRMLRAAFSTIKHVRPREHGEHFWAYSGIRLRMHNEVPREGGEEPPMIGPDTTFDIGEMFNG